MGEGEVEGMEELDNTGTGRHAYTSRVILPVAP